MPPEMGHDASQSHERYLQLLQEPPEPGAAGPVESVPETSLRCLIRNSCASLLTVTCRSQDTRGLALLWFAGELCGERAHMIWPRQNRHPFGSRGELLLYGFVLAVRAKRQERENS